MTLCDYNLVKRRVGGGLHSPVAPMGSIEHPQRHVIQNYLNWASLAIFYQSDPRLTQFLIGPDRFQISLAQPRFLVPCGCQKSACLVTRSWGFLSVCPIHLPFLLRILLAIFSWLLISHRSPLRIKGEVRNRLLEVDLKTFQTISDYGDSEDKDLFPICATITEISVRM